MNGKKVKGKKKIIVRQIWKKVVMNPKCIHDILNIVRFVQDIYQYKRETSRIEREKLEFQC